MLRALLVLGLVFNLAACASTSESESEPTPPPAAAPEPAPEPEPVPVVDSQPVEPPAPVLPKTASSLPALGLTGLVALAGAGLLRAVRRRLG